MRREELAALPGIQADEKRHQGIEFPDGIEETMNVPVAAYSTAQTPDLTIAPFPTSHRIFLLMPQKFIPLYFYLPRSSLSFLFLKKIANIFHFP